MDSTESPGAASQNHEHSASVHIDLYGHTGGGFEDAEWKPEAFRQFEGLDALAYARMKPLPYFNGYTLQTALHDDGECEQHRPTGKVFELEPIGNGSWEFAALDNEEAQP